MNITPEELLKESRTLEPQLQQWRRTLHRHPEVGFDLTQTKALVKTALTEMGYEPKDCGKAGVIALAGGKKPGKTILLRADMDALPIPEDSGEEFSSEVPGKMHGCGHDMHTAMLLGAAKLLKAHEDELEGTVKLEFQPAEEIFQGSPDEFDEETLTTINKFFENSLNVSETSRQLYIHRNTLVYRLDKLQKSTGLDLRVFEDAITFKIALMVVRYMKYMETLEY